MLPVTWMLRLDVSCDPLCVATKCCVFMLTWPVSRDAEPERLEPSRCDDAHFFARHDWGRSPRKGFMVARAHIAAVWALQNVPSGSEVRLTGGGVGSASVSACRPGRPPAWVVLTRGPARGGGTHAR